MLKTRKTGYTPKGMQNIRSSSPRRKLGASPLVNVRAPKRGTATRARRLATVARKSRLA